MGLTSTYDLPYPEGTDLVIGGDDAVQALAERMEAVLTPSWLDLREYAGSLQTTDATGLLVTFPGVESSSGGEWTVSDGTVTYSGTPRPFTITANLILLSSVFGVHSADLAVGGVSRRRSEASVYIPDGGVGRTTHTLQWSGVLSAGTTIQVGAYASGGAGIWYPSLSVMSTGPRQ